MVTCNNCGEGMKHYNSGNGYHVPVCPYCGADPLSEFEDRNL